MKKKFEHPTIDVQIIAQVDVILASLTEGVVLDPFTSDDDGFFA